MTQIYGFGIKQHTRRALRSGLAPGLLFATLLASSSGQAQSQEAPGCGPGAPTCQGRATNILSNPSFEAGNCTPSIPNAFDFGYRTASATVWGRVGCWLGYASPDRFTAQANCSNAGNGVPLNQFNDVTTGPAAPGLQPHGAGGLYAGIYSKAAADAGSHADEREYVIQPLGPALTPERPYYVEYYASLAPASYYTLRTLQVGFTSVLPVSPNTSGAGPVLTGVDVVVSSGPLPTGANPGWSRVSGSFTPPAGSDYRHMILGNFTTGDVNTDPDGFGPSNPERVNAYPSARPLAGAYYYIDDALLVPFPDAGPAVQVACGGQAALGGCGLPPNAGATYSWSPTTGLNDPTSPNPTFTASSTPGQLPVTYTLTVTAGNQQYKTTAVVTVTCSATCGTAAPVCQGQPTNILTNESFEAGECARLTDFGFQDTSGPVWGRVGCWLGYASPDRFTPFVNCASTDVGVYNGVPTNVYNDVQPGSEASRVGRYARTGNQYAGIYAKDASLAGTRADEREYVMQQLPQALTANRPYYAEYYASLAPASYYTLKKLQIGFADNVPVSQNISPGPVLIGVSVVASSGAIPTGANPNPVWTRVGGSFVPPAGSSYRTMILGNFATGDVDLTTAGPGNPSQGANRYPAAKAQLDGAYYYIDDALLVPFPAAYVDAQVSARCGSKFRLGTCGLPVGAGATYSWSPTTGLSDPTAPNPVVSTSTSFFNRQYTLTVTAGGYSYQSSVLVTVNCDFVELPKGDAKDAALVSGHLGQAELQAFPNPTQNRLTLHVRGLSTESARFELVELHTGRVVRTLPAVGNGTADVLVGELPSGVYAGRLLGSAGQTVGTCKVVILR